MTFLNILLDIALIGLLITGIMYAMKLTRQLADMRASRGEMERFVLEFNSTVNRAEAGVRGLKHAARESGDDLEKLIERASGLRDELHFLIESADQIAGRLSATASVITRGTAAQKPDAGEPKMATVTQVKPQQPQAEAKPQSPTSAAERELMRVLGKLG